MKRFYAVLAIVAFVAMVAGSFLGGNAFGAPAGAVLTPVSNNNANNGAAMQTWFSGTPINADTRSCKDVANFDVADMQYVITQSGVNTATIKYQYSNNNSNYVDGATVYSGTPVPASTPFTNMHQQAVFGKYFCVYADLTNATPVSIYWSGVTK